MPDLVKVEPVALVPTQAGCAVFLGDGDKAIMFYIDPAIGASINASMAGQQAPRPLTHDLYLMTLESFGAQVSRVVIVDMADEIYYARLILEVQNEVMERKIVELDCRPSDAIAIAIRSNTPVHVESKLWQRLEDMSALLREIQDHKPDGPPTDF